MGRVFQLIFNHIFALLLGEIWLWLHFLQSQSRILGRTFGMLVVDYPSLPACPSSGSAAATFSSALP